MKKTLTAYRLGGTPMEIRRAPHTRNWMDETREKYAYRCLPLVAANCYGWELLCPENVAALWDGSDELNSITISPKCDFLVSHFGYGIVTFHIPYLFVTSPNADLYVSGPANQEARAAVPLEGIVETSWSPMTFTMNWKLRHHTTSFLRGEPICRIVPIAKNFLQDFEPRIVENVYMPEHIRNEHEAWCQSRSDFLEKLKAEEPETTRQGWQKDYVRQAKVTKLPEFICSQHS